MPSVTSPLVLELFAEKYVIADQRHNVIDDDKPKCDFCQFVLQILSKPDASLDIKVSALEELKTFFSVNKSYDFNQKTLHLPKKDICISNLLRVLSPNDGFLSENKFAQFSKFVCTFLLDMISSCHIDISFQDDEEGNDLIKIAIINKWSADFVTSIIDKITTRESITAKIFLTSKNKCQDTVMSLVLKKGAEEGKGPLVTSLAAFYKAEYQNIDEDGNNLLHFVHLLKNITVCRSFSFLKDFRNRQGNTPLHAMLRSGSPIDDDTFKILVPSQHVINIPNLEGQTLLQAFSKCTLTHTKIEERFKLLADAGADLGQLVDPSLPPKPVSPPPIVSSILINAQAALQSSLVEPTPNRTRIEERRISLLDFEDVLPGSRRCSLVPLTVTPITSSIWDQIPSEKSILPKSPEVVVKQPKSFARVAAASSTTPSQQVKVSNERKNTQKLQILATGGSSCYSDFKRHIFENSPYRELFRKEIGSLIMSATNIDHLITIKITGSEKVRKNRLFSECALRMKSCTGRAVIELVKAFIAYKCNFNLKGDGENTKKTCLLIIVKAFELCSWSEQEKVEIIRLMIEEGKADPSLTDAVGNDALKLAVHLDLPLSIIKVITSNAVLTSTDLFTSDNSFKQNVIQVAKKNREIKNYLLSMKENYEKSRRNSPPYLEQNEDFSFFTSSVGASRNSSSSGPQPAALPKGKNCLSQFTFWKKYPEFKAAKELLIHTSDVNSLYENTPLYSGCLERILSCCLRYIEDKNPNKIPEEKKKKIQEVFDAAIFVTEEFIRQGVNFDAKNYNEMTCLCQAICLYKHYSKIPKSKEFFVRLITLILEQKPDVLLPDSRGNDALKHAMFRKMPAEILERIVDVIPVNKQKYAIKSHHNHDNLNSLKISDAYEEAKVFIKEKLKKLESEEKIKKVATVCVGKDMTDTFPSHPKNTDDVSYKADTSLKVQDFMGEDIPLEDILSESDSTGKDMLEPNASLFESSGSSGVSSSSGTPVHFATGVGQPLGERRDSLNSEQSLDMLALPQATSFAKAVGGTQKATSSNVSKQRSQTMYSLKKGITMIPGAQTPRPALLPPPPGFAPMSRKPWDSFQSQFTSWPC